MSTSPSCTSAYHDSNLHIVFSYYGLDLLSLLHCTDLYGDEEDDVFDTKLTATLIVRIGALHEKDRKSLSFLPQ